MGRRLAPHLELKGAAAVAASLLNRWEDEAALRDAIALAKPGQELGPAGRVYSPFRTLTARGDPFRPERLVDATADLQSPISPEQAAELAAALRETGVRGRRAPIDAAAAAEAVIALKPDVEPLAIWAADAALARALGWPTPLAAPRQRAVLAPRRRRTPAAATWRRTCRGGRTGSLTPRPNCAPREGGRH